LREPFRVDTPNWLPVWQGALEYGILLAPQPGRRNAGVLLLYTGKKTVAPLSAWLERSIIQASSRGWGPFVVNNIPLQPGSPPADLLAQMRAVATKAGVSQVLLVSEHPGSLQPQPRCHG